MDPDFLPIRTQWKNSDPNPEKRIRIKGPGSKTLEKNKDSFSTKDNLDYPVTLIKMRFSEGFEDFPFVVHVLLQI